MIYLNNNSLYWGENINVELPLEISGQIFEGMNEELARLASVLPRVCKNWNAFEKTLWNHFNMNMLPCHIRNSNHSNKEKFMFAFSLINQAKHTRLDVREFYARIYNLNRPLLTNEQVEDLNSLSTLEEKFKFLEERVNDFGVSLVKFISINVNGGIDCKKEVSLVLNLKFNPNFPLHKTPKTPAPIFEICDFCAPAQNLGLELIKMFIEFGADCSHKNSLDQNIFEYLRYRNIGTEEQIHELEKISHSIK